MIHDRCTVFRSLQSTSVLASDTDPEEAGPGWSSSSSLTANWVTPTKCTFGHPSAPPRSYHGGTMFPTGVRKSVRLAPYRGSPERRGCLLTASACGPRTVWAGLTDWDSYCGKRLSRSSYGLLLPRPRGALRRPTAATRFLGCQSGFR